MTSNLSKHNKWKALDRLIDVLVVATLFFLLVSTAQFLWRDFVIASNQLWGEPDNPQFHTVFVQVDTNSFQPELPLAMQFDQWTELLTRIHRGNPAAILVDFQFSPFSYEKLLPGQADRFIKSLITLSESSVLILGLAPHKEVTLTDRFTLNGINNDSRLRKGCMAFGMDFDGVIRDLQKYPTDLCPASAKQSMASLAAELLGTDVKEVGLVLSRGVHTVTSIQADKLLRDQIPEQAFKDAIVVVALNVPYKDEFATSHLTELVVKHPHIKGGLIHALNAEALLENRIAWNSFDFWIYLVAFPVLIIFSWARREQQTAVLLWWTAGSLLAIELLVVNLFLVYLDAIIPALLCIACATQLTARKVIKDLHLKRQIHTLLGGLLSPKVFQQCIDNPEEFFKTRLFNNASVLVLDLKGYSRDARMQSLETLYLRTNTLLAACTQLIHQHGGCVERFRGDGLLAYFGAPLPLDRPLDQAIRSALAILDLLNDPADSTLSEFQHRVRFGISSGEVILGKVGDDQRFDIAVTGLAANRAAHFESMADPVSFPIVVDEQSLNNSTGLGACMTLNQRHPKHPHLVLKGLGTSI